MNNSKQPVWAQTDAAINHFCKPTDVTS